MSATAPMHWIDLFVLAWFIACWAAYTYGADLRSAKVRALG